jgi:hypothetical protein
MNDELNYHNMYYVVNEVYVSWFLWYSDANGKLTVSCNLDSHAAHSAHRLVYH